MRHNNVFGSKVRQFLWVAFLVIGLATSAGIVCNRKSIFKRNLLPHSIMLEAGEEPVARRLAPPPNGSDGGDGDGDGGGINSSINANGAGGGARTPPFDPYAWMRDDARKAPEVLAHIRAENAHADALLAPLAPLARALAGEMQAPLPMVERRAPRIVGEWEYAEVRGPGDDLWDVYRRKVQHPQQQQQQQPETDTAAAAVASSSSAAAAAEAEAAMGGSNKGNSSNDASSRSSSVADGSGEWARVGRLNALGQRHRYFDVAAWAPSPCGRWLAFAADARGDEAYALYALPLAAGGDGGDDAAAAVDGKGSGGGGGGDAWEGPGAPVLITASVAGGGRVAWAPPVGSSGDDGSGAGTAAAPALFALEQPRAHERQGGAETRVVRYTLIAQPPTAEAAGGSGNISSGGKVEDSGGSSGAGVAVVTRTVLLAVAPGALDPELSVSASGRRVMLRYTAGGAGGAGGDAVFALPMEAALASPGVGGRSSGNDENGSSGGGESGSSGGGGGGGGVLAAVPGWREVVPASAGRECRQADHWRGDTYVVIADGPGAPDGRVELVSLLPHALKLPPSKQQQQQQPQQQQGGGNGSGSIPTLIPVGRRRRQALAGGAGGAGGTAAPAKPDNNAAGAAGATAAAATAAPHFSSFEVNEFVLTKSHAAVGARRNGTCVVQVFDLDAATVAAPALPDYSSESDGSSQDGGLEPSPPTPAPLWEVDFANTSAAAGATALVTLAGAGAGGFDAPRARASVTGFVSPLKLYEIDLDRPASALRLVYAEALANDGAFGTEAAAAGKRPGGTPGSGAGDGGSGGDSTAFRFDERDYEAQLLWAPSAGGVSVPMSVAWRRDALRHDGSNPCVVFVYGAYGSKQFPSFDPADLALLNRGFVLAVCHTRGGGELGAAWHRAAQGPRKPATFADAAACVAALAALKFTAPRRTALWGRSAGGLAVAGALNLAAAAAAAAAANASNGSRQSISNSDGSSGIGGGGGGRGVTWPLCGAAVLDVPFVDPLGTMLDPSLLLTVKERPEWGDPLNNAAAFDAIASYSPYQNLVAGGGGAAGGSSSGGGSGGATGGGGGQGGGYLYPALLVTASLWDRRVCYWEPLKYVAQLRHLRRQALLQGGGRAPRQPPLPPLALSVDLEAGHFAASGAGERLRQRALKAAFLVRALTQAPQA